MIAGNVRSVYNVNIGENLLARLNYDRAKKDKPRNRVIEQY